MRNYRFDPLPDYRHNTQCNTIEGEYLTKLCKEAYDYQNIMHTECNLSRLKEFTDCLTKISVYLEKEMPITSNSINDYLIALPHLINNNSQVNFNSFSSFFGRGMQYISFVRK